jgi:hypothetical protein
VQLREIIPRYLSLGVDNATVQVPTPVPTTTLRTLFFYMHIEVCEHNMIYALNRLASIKFLPYIVGGSAIHHPNICDNLLTV